MSSLQCSLSSRVNLISARHLRLDLIALLQGYLLLSIALIDRSMKKSRRFQGNSFEGPIPSSLSNLSELTDLRIGDITIGSSSLDFFSNITSLSNLVLRNCKIFNTIPSSFGQFTNLQKFEHILLWAGELSDIFCLHTTRPEHWCASSGFGSKTVVGDYERRAQPDKVEVRLQAQE